VTTTEPNAGDQKRGRHAKSDEPDRTAEVEPAAEKPATKRSGHAIAHHPAGASLLTASGLVTGLALAPLLFDQLHFQVAARAADAARSAAAPPGRPAASPGSGPAGSR
jgi:hypothetical protein